MSRSRWERRASKLISPLLYRGRLGSGAPAVVIPGYDADDHSTTDLRRILRRLDHDAHGWGHGANLGVDEEIQATLGTELAALHAQSGHPVALIGLSMGGLTAIELAVEHPEHVRLVVTIGSPVTDRWETGPWPSAPLTSIYSRADGVVDWSASHIAPDDRTENVVVRGTHHGMASNALVTRVVADRLLVDPERWYPFAATGWFRLLGPRQPR